MELCNVAMRSHLLTLFGGVVIGSIATLFWKLDSIKVQETTNFDPISHLHKPEPVNYEIFPIVPSDDNVMRYYTPNEVLASTAICVKTYNRPGCLENFLNKVAESWSSNVHVLIADDSSPENTAEVKRLISEFRGQGLGITHIPLPEDSGVAYGRIKLVEHAKDAGFQFILMTDDDYEINTDLLLRMARSLVANDADILAAVRCEGSNNACGQFGFSGSLFHTDRDVLSPDHPLQPPSDDANGGLYVMMNTQKNQHKHISRSVENCQRTDFIQNFFIAKVDVLDDVWDPVLKNNDHYDFLMNTMRKDLTVFVCRDIHVIHKKSSCTQKDSKYTRVRTERWGVLLRHVLEKWHLSSVFSERLMRFTIDETSGELLSQAPTKIRLAAGAESTSQYTDILLREINSRWTAWSAKRLDYSHKDQYLAMESHSCMIKFSGYLYVRADPFASGNSVTSQNPRRCAMDFSVISEACPLLDQMISLTVTNATINRHLYYLTVARDKQFVLEFVNHLQSQANSGVEKQTLCLVFFSDLVDDCNNELASQINDVLKPASIQLLLVCLRDPFGRAIGLRRGVDAIMKNSNDTSPENVVVFALDATLFLQGTLSREALNYVSPGHSVFTPMAVRCGGLKSVALCLRKHTQEAQQHLSKSSSSLKYETFWAGSMYPAIGFALSDYIQLLELSKDGGFRQKWWYLEGATEADLVYQFQTSLNLLIIRTKRRGLYMLRNPLVTSGINRQNKISVAVVTPSTDTIFKSSCTVTERKLLSSLRHAALLEGLVDVNLDYVLRILPPPYGDHQGSTYYTFRTADGRLVLAKVPKPTEGRVVLDSKSATPKSLGKPKNYVAYDIADVRLTVPSKDSEMSKLQYVTPNEILLSTAICVHWSGDAAQLKSFFSVFRQSLSKTLPVYITFSEQEAGLLKEMIHDLVESGLTIHSIPVSGMAIRTRLLLEAVKSAGFSHVIMTDDTFLIKDDLLLSMARSLHTYSAQVVAPTTCSDNKDPSSCNHEMLGSVLVSESSENGNTVFFLRDFIRNNSQDLQPSTPHTCVRSDLFGLFYLAEIDALWGTNDIDWYGTSQGTQTGRFDMWLTARKRNLAIFSCTGIVVERQSLPTCSKRTSLCNSQSPTVVSRAMSKWNASEIWAGGSRFERESESGSNLISADTDKSTWRLKNMDSSDEDGHAVLKEINKRLTAWSRLSFVKGPRSSKTKVMVSNKNACITSYKGQVSLRYHFFESRNANASNVLCNIQFSRLKETCPVLDQVVSVRNYIGEFPPSDYDHNQRHLYYLTTSSFGNKVLAFAEYLKNQKSAYVGAPVSRTFAVVFYGDDLKHCRNELTIQLQNLLREASVKVLVVCLRMPFGRAIGLRRGMQAILEDSASIAPENVVVFSLDTSIHLKDTVTENAMRYVLPGQTMYAPIVVKCDPNKVDTPKQCMDSMVDTLKLHGNGDGYIEAGQVSASWVGVGYGIIAFAASDYKISLSQNGGYRDLWWYRYGVEDQDIVWQMQIYRKLLVMRIKSLELYHLEKKDKVYTKNKSYYMKKNVSPFAVFTPRTEIHTNAAATKASLVNALSIVAKKNDFSSEIDWNTILRTDGPRYNNHVDSGKTFYSVFLKNGGMRIFSLNQPINGRAYCKDLHKATYSIQDESRT
eukprot:m.199882 g.199882  ORF g.199882 m.199882 type:complete len:1638 (+) comp15732_c0_seq7:345-5258(+)